MEASKEDCEVVNKNNSVSIKVTNRHAFDCCNCSAFLTNIPVFQCDNGHIVCSTCCNKLGNKCHKCSTHVTLKRCKAIENILRYVEIPCPNEKHGCKETISCIGKSKHEEECIYVPCYCPISGCDFVASSEVLSNHFSHKHSKPKFSYDHPFCVSLKYHDEAIVFQAAIDGKLFILNHSSMLMGKAVLVNISCIGPNLSDDEYIYDIMARSKKCSLKLQSCTKNVQRIALATISSEFLMIPFGYFGSLEPLRLEICIHSMMQIYIRDLTGTRTPLRVNSSDTIVNVKLKILDKKRVPVHQQSLIFNHMQLDDRMTIADCNIKEKSTIHLQLRLTGN
ncbi:E3 ubiquitin-protein ligase SINA [Trifolium repens]|nr:E3 ubiquitin-protein ligase SINA [Trifolium repens]